MTGFLEFQEKFAGLLTNPVSRRRFAAVKPHVLAERSFRKNMSVPGVSSMPQGVLEQCLARSQNSYDVPVDAATALAATGRSSEALAVLEAAFGDQPASWDAARVRTLCHLALRRPSARKFAEQLMSSFPWRAESFDVARFVYSALGDRDIAEGLSQSGDALFDKEMRQFDELKNHLDALRWPSPPG